MKGKLAVTALLMAGVLAAPAYAAQGSQLAATFNNQDIQSLFVDNQQPMHLAVLSPMEMKTTQEGASLQEVIFTQGMYGTLGGTLNYLANNLGNSQSVMTPQNLAINMLAGFAGGAAGGIVGVYAGSALGIELGNTTGTAAGALTEGYVNGLLSPASN